VSKLAYSNTLLKLKMMFLPAWAFNGANPLSSLTGLILPQDALVSQSIGFMGLTPSGKMISRAFWRAKDITDPWGMCFTGIARCEKGHTGKISGSTSKKRWFLKCPDCPESVKVEKPEYIKHIGPITKFNDEYEQDGAYRIYYSDFPLETYYI
jgi:hypothetical protein